VTSRTSSFALRDSNASVSEVGGLFNADFIVEGSVRRSESTVRITAQLIRANVDTHLWSDTYDRPLRAADLIEVQETIARTITDRLQASVLPDDPSKANPPRNFAALDAYLLGLD
jgi:TolB-like protein